MRLPAGRHDSSTRSMRKGDSLTGALSLSRVLSPSPATPGALEEEQEVEEEPRISPGGSMAQQKKTSLL